MVIRECEDGIYDMNKRNIIHDLNPFWIYFIVVFLGNIALFVCPILLFIVLPLAIVLVVVAFGVVYMVGKAVQNRIGKNKRIDRVMVAAVCSLLIAMIFPVCDLVKIYIEWQTLHIDKFWGYIDVTFIIVVVVHFIAFWVGEEIEYMANKNEEY